MTDQFLLPLRVSLVSLFVNQLNHFKQCKPTTVKVVTSTKFFENVYSNYMFSGVYCSREVIDHSFKASLWAACSQLPGKPTSSPLTSSGLLKSLFDVDPGVIGTFVPSEESNGSLTLAFKDLKNEQWTPLTSNRRPFVTPGLRSLAGFVV